MLVNNSAIGYAIGMFDKRVQRYKCVAGMMVEIRRGAARGMQNIGDEPFRVLVLKLFSE